MDANLTVLHTFRDGLYTCFYRRADALFELADTLSVVGIVPSSVHLSNKLVCRAHRYLTPEVIAALIAGGACNEWGRARRPLLWALPGAWRGATGLPLPSPPVRLADETAIERITDELWATGLPLSGHPAATAGLDVRSSTPRAALVEAPGRRLMTVAGRLVIWQQPETAKGMPFAMIEGATAWRRDQPPGGQCGTVVADRRRVLCGRGMLARC